MFRAEWIQKFPNEQYRPDEKHEVEGDLESFNFGKLGEMITGSLKYGGIVEIFAGNALIWRTSKSYMENSGHEVHMIKNQMLLYAALRSK